jgi:hypothetical protein
VNKQDGRETNNDDDLMQVQNAIYRQMPESPKHISIYLEAHGIMPGSSISCP